MIQKGILFEFYQKWLYSLSMQGIGRSIYKAYSKAVSTIGSLFGRPVERVEGAKIRVSPVLNTSTPLPTHLHLEGKQSLQNFLGMEDVELENIESIELKGGLLEEIEEGEEFPRVIFGHELGERFGDFESQLHKMKKLKVAKFPDLIIPGGLCFRVPDNIEELELGEVIGEIQKGAHLSTLRMRESP